MTHSNSYTHTGKISKFTAIFMPLVFLIIGLATGFFAGYQGYNYLAFKNISTETTAQIIDINSDETREQISFTVDDKEYIVTLSYYSSTDYIGKEITILYETANPYHVKAQGGEFILIGVFGGIGVLFILIGGSMLITLLISESKKKRLKSTGRMIWCTVDQIYVNTRIAVNRINPFVIIAKNSVGATYKSPNIFDDLSNIAPGDRIAVYVNMNKEKEFYIDYSQISKNTSVNDSSINNPTSNDSSYSSLSSSFMDDNK